MIQGMAFWSVEWSKVEVSRAMHRLSYWRKIHDHVDAGFGCGSDKWALEKRKTDIFRGLIRLDLS